MEIPPLVRRYWLPILLITAGFLFQLLVLSRSYPPSHYDGESSRPSAAPPLRYSTPLICSRSEICFSVGLLWWVVCSARNREVRAGREGGRGLRPALQGVVSLIDLMTWLIVSGLSLRFGLFCEVRSGDCGPRFLGVGGSQIHD
jgi:hypothetical protein